MRYSELKYAMRSLWKRRAVTAITILVLALGIGANSAIFSIVYAVLLRPLPFSDPERLVQIWHVPPPKSFPGFTKFAVSPANLLDLQSRGRLLESVAAYHGRDFTLTGAGDPLPVHDMEVGPAFFNVLQAAPRLGRVFSQADGEEGAAPSAVLSEAFWRTRLNSDPAVIGHTLRLSDRPYTIVGVMQKGFMFPPSAPPTQVWTCLQWDAKERAVRGNHNYMAIGRLKDGMSLQRAQSELSAIATQLEKEYPADDAGWGAKLVPLREELVGDVRPALLVLLGAVGFVLLIACANVMNLTLAITLARREELAIRTAIGASQRDLIRQVLLETVLLGLAGGTLGILFANWGIQLIVHLLSDELPRVHEIGINGTVVLFTAGLSVLAGLLSGLVPAARFAKADVNDALKRASQRTESDALGRRTRNSLVIAETSMCLVLLTGAGLMIRTFSHLQKIDIGIDPANLVVVSAPLPETRYKTQEEKRAFYARALDAVRAIPGISSASIVDSLPLTGGSTQPIMIEGRPTLQMADQPEVPVRRIGTGYLATMRIPLLRGRDFSASDAPGTTPVILITESLAREFFPNEDPMGKHITLELTDKSLEVSPTPREIVGIVGDVRLTGPEDDRHGSAVYLPAGQVSSNYMTLVARSGNQPAAILSAFTGAIHKIDPSLALVDSSTMDEVVGSAIAQRRFTMQLLVAFAGIALVLAAVGIYSVLSYTVRRRVKEIGIRIALGARIADVVQLVVADGLKPTLVGLALGLFGALALGRTLTRIIYGVSAHDSLTLASASALLVAIALVACAFPAYRATQVQPVNTLREE